MTTAPSTRSCHRAPDAALSPWGDTKNEVPAEQSRGHRAPAGEPGSSLAVQARAEPGDLGRATKVRIAPGRINGLPVLHVCDGTAWGRGYQSALTTVPLCSVDTVARALP